MWRFAAGRATGSSHLRAGLPCQDRVRCLVDGSGTLIAAVADGAGSASRAEAGAELATEILTSSAAAAVADGRCDYASILREGAITAREAIFDAARRESATPRDFAATLLAVIVGPHDGAALQIGDGVIVVGDGGEGWSWVFWPQRGEYANTTRFITDEDAILHLRAERLASVIHDVAVLTDGLESLALQYASKAVHNPFFCGLFGPLYAAAGSSEIVSLSGHLEAFLASSRVRERVDDDVSLVIATRSVNTVTTLCS